MSETFEAIRGFPQGAAESPLLWIIFYDMVTCQLKREGVGASVRTPGTYGQEGHPGITVFADDTAFFENSAVATQRSATIVEETLGLVCLRVAPAKSQHVVLAYTETVRGKKMNTIDEIRPEQRIKMAGLTLPLVGADEALRYLGFWVESTGTWGHQADFLRYKISQCLGDKVKPARITKAET
jgi:hypothetical protein